MVYSRQNSLEFSLHQLHKATPQYRSLGNHHSLYTFHNFDMSFLFLSCSKKRHNQGVSSSCFALYWLGLHRHWLGVWTKRHAWCLSNSFLYPSDAYICLYDSVCVTLGNQPQPHSTHVLCMYTDTEFLCGLYRPWACIYLPLPNTSHRFAGSQPSPSFQQWCACSLSCEHSSLRPIYASSRFSLIPLALPAYAQSDKRCAGVISLSCYSAECPRMIHITRVGYSVCQPGRRTHGQSCASLLLVYCTRVPTWCTRQAAWFFRTIVLLHAIVRLALHAAPPEISQEGRQGRQISASATFSCNK